MNVNDTSIRCTASDRFPDSSEGLPKEVQECRGRLSSKKDTLPGPYGLLIHSPALADAFDALSTALWQGDVPRRVMEGLFLLNAQRHLCRYQWVRHVEKARQEGLAESVIQSVAAGLEPAATDDQAFHVAWRLATTLQLDGPVEDQLFSLLQEHFSLKAVAELVAFCGFASIVSNALRVRQPALPEGVRAPF